LRWPLILLVLVAVAALLATHLAHLPGDSFLGVYAVLTLGVAVLPSLLERTRSVMPAPSLAGPRADGVSSFQG
jgi:hypothetical protein